ncbi:WVD2-like protein 7 [Tanacetum coccineum]
MVAVKWILCIIGSVFVVLAHYEMDKKKKFKFDLLDSEMGPDSGLNDIYFIWAGLTEPLKLGRWSSFFSTTDTLEDVQKYSRPGVVAEKKAFFEAHYKNFALKKTAKLHEKENQAPPNYSPQINGIASKVDVHAPSTISPVNSDDIISSTIQVCDFENNVPSTSQVEKVKMSTGNVDFEDHQFQVKVSNRSSLVDKIKKRHIKDAASDPSPRKAPLTPTVHPKKAAGVVTDKKRSVLQSLHMSMNFPAARNKDVASKTTSKPNDRLTQQALTRVSVSGLKENSQVLPRPEHARSKTPSERLVNGSRTVTPKSHSTNHSDTSSPCTKKPRSPTVPSSFSFRSDERAAKRKEASPELDFFKKIEEKGNTNDTKKIQFQPKLKEKARSDNKRLRWSTAVEVKPTTRETKAPINSMQKVTPTKPCSPKLGRKPAPRPVEDTQSPPWRSSSKPKNFIEINKKKLILVDEDPSDPHRVLAS